MTARLNEALPPSLRELTAAIEADERRADRGGTIIHGLARRFAALHDCDVCGRPIVEIDALARALLAYYGHAGEPDIRLARVLRDARLETGDTLSPNYCSYHGQIIMSE